MRLKRVRIYGFKTFADRADIEIGEGISAVVGPNGCGKSNIVDAVLWGLGETNSRHIRAQNSQEVIFNGAKNRRPQGYAEVTLIFDNEDGQLPIESAEVSITRRLNRKGDSDYQINGRNCRLRDVADLLADTGLGRAGYAIVGQSEIDQALAASAEQRRAWVDEAAGVQRYRWRRQDAQRRLTSANTQLQRVRDVIAEIEVQRAPLAIEAEIARRYRAIADELRLLEEGLLVRDLADAIRETDEAKARQSTAETQILVERDALASLELGLAKLTEELAQLDTELETKRTERFELERAIERSRAEHQIALGKIEALDTLEQTLGSQTDELAQRREEAIRDLADAKQAESEAHLALAQLKEEAQLTDTETARLNEALRAAEAALASAQAIEERRRTALAQAGARAHRIERIDEELEGIAASLPDLDAGETEAKTNVEAAQAALDALLTERKAVRDKQTELESTRIAIARRLENLQSEIAGIEGKIRGLQATLEAHDGRAAGTRAVLAAAEQGLLPGTYVPVTDAVDVDPDHALAIETALGGAANDLIVPSEAEARAAIQLLKEQQAGRATFQPLTLVRPSAPSSELNDVLRRPGVIGQASALAQCAPEHRPVIESLLGRVIIVETLDVALALAKTKGWNRLVSLDGEVVHGSGAVTGGRAKHQSTGILQRRAELNELELDLEDARKELRSFEGKAQKLAAEREQLTQTVAALELKEQDARTELGEAQHWLARISSEHQSTLRARDRLHNERNDLLGISEEHAGPTNVAELQTERDRLMRDLAARSAEAGSMGARLTEAELFASQAQLRHIEAQRRLAKVEETIAFQSRKSSDLGPERERILASIAEFAQRETGERTAAQTLDTLIAALTADRTEATQRRSEQERERAVIAARVDSLSQTARTAALDATRAEGRRVGLAERLIEEFGITEEQAVAAAPNVEVPEDATRRAVTLRREIRSMGEVNLGSIDAYERLTERYTELTAQEEDVTASMDELRSSIAELDRQTRKRFLEAFHELQGHFRQTFQDFFPEGSAEVSLTNPDDALESGLDIDVVLPGKRSQRLELLSGGERALSAIAFLFALLRVKPTPLVVLDEVDAPLDGRNVERFASALSRYTDRTQFLVVTHNPVTIEAADVWFGVTMQEPGVSTIIPFKTAGRELAETIVPGPFLK